MVLTLRTDNPEAEIGLFDKTGAQISYLKWQANRNLAKELLAKLVKELKKANASFESLKGIVVYQGPGSFTGLRIGITVVNTIAYAQEIPIVAAQGEEWIRTGLKRLAKNEDDRIVLPHYGAEANISTPKQ